MRQAARLALDLKTINQALTLGFSHVHGSLIPDNFEFFWKPPEPVYDPEKAKQLLAAAGYPDGFDAGYYNCDSSYANLAEATNDYLGAVGIRAKLRPLERASFNQQYADKKLKNIMQGGSGSFGNAATRLETFVVKGGAYVYGSYPDLDAMFEQQAVELDHGKASGDPDKDAADRLRTGHRHASLAACVHQRRRAACRRVQYRQDRRVPVYGAL